MEYQDLLRRADKEDDPVIRIQLVASFCVAQYKCTDARLNKPFNPILGETFELKGEDYTYFAEQVSHHPPVSACIGESEHYKYHMDTDTKMSISWKGILLAIPIGFQHVVLKSRDEHYVISRPTTTVNNLLFGTMYIEHVGTMNVKNYNNGMICPVEFSAAGWGNVGRHEVHGQVWANEDAKKKGGKPLANMRGKWSESISTDLESKKGEKLLWKCTQNPEKYDWQYFFTNFAMQLNNLPEDLKKRLPISDSRLRPDQRALENGEYDLAASEKHRLEEKQRAARKFRAENPGNDFKPKYFKKIVDPDSKEAYYAYGIEDCRDYWQDRKNKDFGHMEDLY